MIWEMEIESPVPAAQMFEAAVVHWHNIGPQILPDILKSATADGMVRELNFESGVMPYSNVKEFMNYVNYQDLECVLTTMDGGFMETKLKLEYTRYKIEPGDESVGCVVKVVTTAELIKGVEETDLEGDIDKIKEAMVHQFKAVEGYLLENPEAFHHEVRTRTPILIPLGIAVAGAVAGGVAGAAATWAFNRFFPSEPTYPKPQYKYCLPYPTYRAARPY